MSFGDQVKVIGWYDNEWGYSNRLADLTALVGRPALMRADRRPLDVAGQAVLLRADLNVPLDGDVITDDGRVRASLPTIRTLSSRGARVIICAHLGRPKGETYADPGRGRPVPAAGRRPARRAARPAGPACRATWSGESAAAVVAGLGDGEVGLLENVRFDPAETSKDDAERTGLAARLAALADPLRRRRLRGPAPQARQRVRRARAAPARRRGPGHRRDRGAPPAHLRPAPGRTSWCSAGPSRRTSWRSSSNLLGRADRLIICGGMSYTFLAAQGYEVGKSLLEADQIPQVTEVLAEAARRGVEVVLPVDLVAADRFAPDADHRVVPVSEFPADRESLDMGPETRALFAQKLSDAKTVFWNGPAGRVRVPGLRRRNPGRGRGDQPRQRADRGRRRRLRGGRAPAWASPRTRSRTSPRAAGRAWNTWRAGPCPGSARWGLQG